MNESQAPEIRPATPADSMSEFSAGSTSDATRLEAPRRDFGSWRRRAVGGFKRFSRRSALALSAWSSLDANPFLARAFRIETRRGKPLWTLAGMAIFSALLFWLTWWLWNLALQNNATLRDFHPLGSLPPALGRHQAGLFAIVTLAASTYGALYATRARAAYLLRQELFGSTLDALQLLPQPEERWVWWLSAHPTLLSLLIGLAGLPVYTLAIIAGAWSVRDLAGITLLFVFIGHIAPSWQPLLWQQQAAAKSGKPNKFDWKAWQESLKAERAGRDQSTLSPQEALEEQRRTQRAMAGLTQWPTAPDSTTPGAKEDEQAGGKRGLFGKKSAGSANGAGGATWNWGRASWFWVWLSFQGFGGLTRLMTRGGGGGLSTFWDNIGEALPADVASLLYPGPVAIPILMLNWPLLVSRLLISPLPFFSFWLTPFLILLPLWIGLRHQWNQALAAQVSARETFWTLRRARVRANVGVLLWLLLYFLVFGYGWQTLIRDGELLPLLRGLPPGITALEEWALAAAWTLAIVLGAIVAGNRQEKPLQRATLHTGPEPLALPALWREATWAGVRALGIAVGLYFVACWLGRSSGVNAAWSSRLAPTLAIAGAFVLADLGSGALQTALPIGVRSAMRTLRTLWFGGLAALTIALIAYLAVRGVDFSFDLAPVVLLSPYVSLLSLFRHDISFPGFFNGAWWGPPLVQSTLGALCWVVAHSLHERRAPLVEEQPADGAQTTLDRFIDIVVWPLQTLAAGARWTALKLLDGFEWVVAQLRRLNDWIVQWGAHWNNPVLSDELRRRLNREWWPAQWIFFQLSAVSLFWLFGEPIAALAGGAAALSNLGEGTVIFAAVVFAIASYLMPLAIGKSFDRERANGQLVFLFLTPMTDREIVVGKLVPGLMHLGMLWSVALPWLLGGSLVALTGGNQENVFIALYGSWAALVNGVLVACVAVAFAVRARKPGEGIGKALASLFVIHAVLWGGSAYVLLELLEIQDAFGPMHFLAGSGALLALAFGAWKWALVSFKRQRYNEAALRGKGAS